MENKIRILKNNRPYLSELNILKSETDYIKIEYTRIGLPTLKIIKDNNQIYLHSKYDPLKEAENFVSQFSNSESDIIILLGLGLGYHLKKISEKFPEKYIIACELDINIFKNFLEFSDEKLLQNEKIIFLVTEDKINLLDSVLRYLIYIKLKKEAKISILSHPPSFKINPDYEKVKLEASKRIAEIYSDYLTVKEFKNLWQRNIERNIKLINSSNKLIELKNFYRNKPMIIISAGPSLEKNLKFIKNNSKMIKVSVDTALKFLVKNNIKPDYVLSLDAKYENLNDFKYIDLKNIKLVYDIVTFFKIPLLFENRYITYTLKLIPDLYGNLIEYRDEPVQRIIEKYGDFGGLQSGGSVSTNALDFALFTGANPIYFVGLDLVNINFKSHCKNTAYEYFFLQRTNKFFPFHSLEFKNIITRSFKSYVKNNNIISEEFIFNKYKKWFDDAFDLLKKNNIKVEIIN